jgi:TfoX/Sxy family transcriptional regulator of competence genes
MRFEKSPPSLVALFESQIAGTGADRRQMFGCPCAFVSGQMCAGLFADQLFLRLGEAERAALLAVAGARPFEPMPGRPMREYVAVPPSLLADAASLRSWIGKAVAYARSLPPKGKRARHPGAGKAPTRRPQKPARQRAGRGKR